MGTLSVFNFITLNGFYKGPQDDISWHKHGEEEAAYAAEGAQSNSTLLFGRVTYGHMVSFWPTPAAMETMPEVAKGMNASEKIVFSRTLTKTDWNNTRIVKDNMVEEVKKWKAAGKIMTVLGSGSIVTQLAEAGLIDDYLLMVDPVAIGDGTPIFKGIKHELDLQLVNTRTFKSGVVLLSYKPR
jgi:dihydrofolate reductase